VVDVNCSALETSSVELVVLGVLVESELVLDEVCGGGKAFEFVARISTEGQLSLTELVVLPAAELVAGLVVGSSV
jgi:hypothetical protein